MKEFYLYTIAVPVNATPGTWLKATTYLQTLTSLGVFCVFFAGEDIVFLATDINLPGAVDWVMMQSCFGDNFMLVLEKQERYEGQQLFYAIVQLIGTKKQAENFAYRYENYQDGLVEISDR